MWVDLLYDLLEEQYEPGRHVDAAERPSKRREQRGSPRARRDPHWVQGVSRRLQAKTIENTMVELAPNDTLTYLEIIDLFDRPHVSRKWRKLNICCIWSKHCGFALVQKVHVIISQR